MSLLDVESILDERIDPYDLEKFRDIYIKQCSRGVPSTDAVFGYASALIRSTKNDVKEGVDILEKLIRDESYEKSRRDYVFYLALGYARLKDYDRALAYIDILLNSEKDNRQVRELKEVIERKMKKDGLLGAAILGGGATLVAGVMLAAVMAFKK